MTNDLDEKRVSLLKQIHSLKKELKGVIQSQRKQELINKAKEDSKSMTPEQRSAVIQTLQAEGIGSSEVVGNVKKK